MCVMYEGWGWPHLTSAIVVRSLWYLSVNRENQLLFFTDHSSANTSITVMSWHKCPASSQAAAKLTQHSVDKYYTSLHHRKADQRFHPVADCVFWLELNHKCKNVLSLIVFLNQSWCWCWYWWTGGADIIIIIIPLTAIDEGELMSNSSRNQYFVVMICFTSLCPANWSN